MKRTIVITGGTSGIGMYTAIGVAREGAKIVVTGRDPQRGAKGVETIQRESAITIFLLHSATSRLWLRSDDSRRTSAWRIRRSTFS